MSSFNVDLEQTRNAASQIEGLKRELVSIRSAIKSERDDLHGINMFLIKLSLDRVISQIDRETLSVQSLATVLKDIAHLYEHTDKRILNEYVNNKEVIYRDGTTNVWEAFRDLIRRILAIFGIITAGDDEDSIFISDPVNVCTGNYISAVTELYFAGTPALSFVRYYNSLYPDQGTMGTGWTHNYEITLTNEEDHIDVKDGDQRTERYQMVGDGVYISRHNHFNCITEEDGYTLFMHDGMIRRFDTEGRIISSAAQNGKKIFFEYEDGKLMQAYDEAHRSLYYNYDEENCLTSVSDSAGRMISFQYDNGLLTRVVSADGREKSYKYDTYGRILQIVNNAGICVIRNEFDRNNRVTRQSFPDGTEMTYAYKDMDVVVTDRNGAVTTYRHNERYQITDEIRSDGTQHYAYDENNLRTKYTDAEGAVFCREYDENGNVVSITDAMGRSVTLSYEIKGLPHVITERNGATTTREYDSGGNVVRYEDALGNETKFVYENGSLTEVLHPDGSSVRFVYDEKGYLVSRTDEMDNTTTFVYDEAGRMISRTDPRGMTYSFTYDPCDRILSVKNPLGRMRVYEYSLTGKIQTITDFDGYRETYEYNALDLCSRRTDKGGRVTEFTYDANGNLSGILLPNGSSIRHEYDGYNRRTATVNELGLRTEYKYNGDGRLIRKSDGRLVTTIEYDPCGRAILVRETALDDKCNAPLIRERCTERDEEGRVTSLTCPDGSVYSYEYDLLGRCVERMDPAGKVTAYSYNERGKLISITREGRELRHYSYYPNGKLREMAGPDKKPVRYEYDAAGNRTKIVYDTGYQISYEYDELNRCVKMSDTSGRSAVYAYDDKGRVTKRIDACGYISKYTYSPTGMVTAVEDAIGNTISCRYDQMDHLVGIIQGEDLTDRNVRALKEDREEHRVLFERNARGLITGITDAEGNATAFEYNQYGEMISRATPGRVRTEFDYDAYGKNTGISFDDGRKVRKSYDVMGRMLRMEDWNGCTSVQYDPLGRIINLRDAEGKALSYEWDHFDGRTAIRYPDGAAVYYDADDLGRLSRIRTEDGDFLYSYDDYGRLASKESPGGKAEYTYYSNGKVESLVFLDRDGKMSEQVFAYDERGNIRMKKEWSRKTGTLETVYEYDALNRIQKVIENGKKVRSYSYDSFGNRVLMEEDGKKTHYVYNRLNQLIRREVVGDTANNVVTTWEYDADGNAVRQNSTSFGERKPYSIRFSYDSASNLSVAEGSDGMCYVFEYDGFGMRRRRTSYTNAFEGTSVNANGTENAQKTSYVYDFSVPRKPLISSLENGVYSDYIRDGELTGLLRDKELGTYWCDLRGSVCSYDPGNGDKVFHYRYDEFGNTEGAEDHLMRDAGCAQPFRFAGMLWDGGIRTYVTHARMYSPEIGRFLMKDEDRFISVMNPQSVNLYDYCLNNPVMYVDPDGNDCYYFYLPEWYDEALTDQKYLAEKYGYDIDKVHLIPITNDQQLKDGWNAMGTENGEKVDIDTVVINTHADPYELSYGKNSNDKFSVDDAYALDDKSMDQLILYGCNAGHRDYADENIANAFSHKVNNAPVMASDGTVYGKNWDDTYTPTNDEEFQDWAEKAGNGGRDNEGWQIYQQVDGRTVVTNTGIKAATILTMLRLINKNRLKGIRE